MSGTVDMFALLQTAHQEATRRDNVSSVTFINAFAGSGSYTQAVAAAILTTGEVHAPVVQICDVLLGGTEFVNDVYLMDKRRVPGWGNNFVKGPDPSLVEIFNAVGSERPDILQTIEQVTKMLHNAGKMVYPNIGNATAAVALTIGMPSVLSPHLFILCRLPAWYELAFQYQTRE